MEDDLDMESSNDQQGLKRFFLQLGMKPNLDAEDATTELGSQIDVCFSNVCNLSVSIA